MDRSHRFQVITLRVSQKNEMICRTGGETCVFFDDWTSKFTRELEEGC